LTSKSQVVDITSPRRPACIESSSAYRNQYGRQTDEEQRE